MSKNKVTITIKKEIMPRYLQARVGARYWEDSEINGTPDTENGDNIPCKEGDYWCPLIDLSNGQIVNWEKGKTADIHYKSCDNNKVTLLDENQSVVAEPKNYYVPDILVHGEGCGGDYVVMEIDADGFIKDFVCDLSDLFFEEED